VGRRTEKEGPFILSRVERGTVGKGKRKGRGVEKKRKGLLRVHDYITLIDDKKNKEEEKRER